MAKAKAAAPAANDVAFPDAGETAAALGSFSRDARCARPLSFMQTLAANPPQVLLLEGGSADERRLAALYWATLLNCPESFAPCLACSVCLRILGGTHRDLFYLDGRAESIKIEDVRGLRAIIGEAPRDARKRVIILAEAQSLTEAAANAMLKSLEEPRPDTVFVLLAPQRERLLPTLVSRSWVLTLPWPDGHADGRARGAEEQGWDAALASFARNGAGLFERTGARGGMDQAAAQTALLVCQRALTEALSGADSGSGGQMTEGLARFFTGLSDERRRMADEVLAEVQDSLSYMVNPALIVEWLATRLYLLGR